MVDWQNAINVPVGTLGANAIVLRMFQSLPSSLRLHASTGRGALNLLRFLAKPLADDRVSKHQGPVLLDFICRWVAKGIGAKQCDPCGFGSFCPQEGSSLELPCPYGTYRTGGFGSSLNSCHQCPPYKACTELGEVRKDLPDCDAGYYCIYGSTSQRPSKEDRFYDFKKAGPCPAGLYCEQGRPPMPCPRGKIGVAEMLASKGECTPCETGRYLTHSLIRP